MLEIRIKETNEIETLVLMTNGHDWAEDFVDLSDFDIDDEDYYVVDKETFEFWESLVEAKQKSEDLKSEYANLITDEVLNEIHESSFCDFSDSVYAELAILERIIEENC